MATENKEKIAIIITFIDGTEDRIIVEVEEDRDKSWDKASSFYRDIENGKCFICHPDKWESYNIEKIKKITLIEFTKTTEFYEHEGEQKIYEEWSWKTVKK